jgi:uncharacterized repeat protein (TIGR03803 family)
MTRLGGTNDFGVIFEYDIATNTITKKVDFTGTNGESPTGNLVQAPNGKLYGMTERGGANTIGVLFEYDPATNVYSKKLDFNGTVNGGTPNGSLELSSNGKLYGFTTSGGANSFGVLFEYEAATSTYTKKQDFAGPNGAYPYKGSLLFSYCAVPAKPVVSVTKANTVTPTLTSSSTTGNQWYLNGAIIAGAINATLQVVEVGIYKVQVQVDVCLSDFSDEEIFVITGVERSNIHSVQAYPNPVNDWLTISLGELSGKKEITIIDLNGRKLESKEESGKEARFNVAPYPSGMYLVKVKAQESITTIRFVKK